ncbi:MAG: hypothetical protein ACN6OV_03835 [Acinetobacter sp.]|uniref:hypothetical protein n=1 Tax=Acinetobacter sp. TaxID=472 RepID=UPI003CFF435B
MKKTLLAISLSCLLAACGGGSSDNDSSNGGPSDGNPPTSNLQTGVLTDGPVGNVRYETSSGVKGFTNERGEFEYKAGDSVTFYLGNIELGTTTAQAHITPIELSEDENIRTNLLILLQSLDKDQDHSNGIAISNDAIEALADKTLNLSLPTVSFVADSTLKKVLEDLKLVLVSEEDAKNNFFYNFIKDNAGAWVLEDKTDNSKVILYIDDNITLSDEHVFNFILGETAPSDDVGQSGIEKGKMHWNPTTGQLSRPLNHPEFEIDTNGEWGLSHPQENFTLAYGVTKDTLILKEGESTHTFKKAENKANSVVGTWVTEGLVVNLASDKSFMTLSTENDECASPGIESGTYNFGQDFIQAMTITTETSGCAGLVDTWGDFDHGQYTRDKFGLLLNGNSLTITYKDEETGEVNVPVIFAKK